MRRPVWCFACFGLAFGVAAFGQTPAPQGRGISATRQGTNSAPRDLRGCCRSRKVLYEDAEWGRKETIIWPPHGPIYTYGAIFFGLV